MTKGKPWSPEHEKQLRELVRAGKSIKTISEALGKTETAIRQKMIKLELKEEKKSHSKFFSSTSSLPAELPNMERQLKVLAAALELLQTRGLDRIEILRLRSIVTGVQVYQELLADFLGFAELERRLFELEAKYAELAKDTVEGAQGS